MKLKAFKYRIYPTEAQKEFIHKHFGCARWIYNYALNKKINAYKEEKKTLSHYEIKKELPALKADANTAWLKEVDSHTLVSSLMNLDSAYKNFFKGRTGFPKFKSKHDGHQSYQSFQSVKVNFDSQELTLPKFDSRIKIIIHRKFEGKIKTTTISKTPTGKYFASILAETNEIIPDKVPIIESQKVGIDLGLKTFAVISDGTKIENPKHLKSALRRLKLRQRALSRKQKGSNSRAKAKLQVALTHEKVANKRNDFLHKASAMIVNKYDTIGLEDLNVNGMVKNSKLSQAISDASWGKFVELVKYKAEWSGKNVGQNDRFAPSSKLCTCGVKNKDLKLSDRVWTCESCGVTHDRDLLAANNIKKMAIYPQNKIREEIPKFTRGSYESQ